MYLYTSSKYRCGNCLAKFTGTIWNTGLQLCLKFELGFSVHFLYIFLIISCVFKLTFNFCIFKCSFEFCIENESTIQKLEIPDSEKKNFLWMIRRINLLKIDYHQSPFCFIPRKSLLNVKKDCNSRRRTAKYLNLRCKGGAKRKCFTGMAL